MRALTPMLVGLLLLPAAPVAAVDGDALHCRLLAHEARRDRDDARLDLRLAEADLVASEQLLDMVDDLAVAKTIDRLTLLRWTWERDTDRVELERAKHALAREEAAVAQFERACAEAPGPEAGEAGPGDGADAFASHHRRYREHDCRTVALDLEIARIDRAYRKEVLTTYGQLRLANVGNKQDVIGAERDLERARRAEAHQRERRARCREELDALAP